MKTNKVKINGVSINLDAIKEVKKQDLPALGFFDKADTASYDLLWEAMKGKEIKPEEPVK